MQDSSLAAKQSSTMVSIRVSYIQSYRLRLRRGAQRPAENIKSDLYKLTSHGIRQKYKDEIERTKHSGQHRNDRSDVVKHIKMNKTPAYQHIR